MREVWVVDASPLIVLAKSGLGHLLRELPDEVVIPRAVAKEVAAGREDDPARSLWQSLSAARTLA